MPTGAGQKSPPLGPYDILAPDMAWVNVRLLLRLFCVSVCLTGKYSKLNTLFKPHKLSIMSIAKKWYEIRYTTSELLD